MCSSTHELLERLQLVQPLRVYITMPMIPMILQMLGVLFCARAKFPCLNIQRLPPHHYCCFGLEKAVTFPNPQYPQSRHLGRIFRILSRTSPFLRGRMRKWRYRISSIVPTGSNWQLFQKLDGKVHSKSVGSTVQAGLVDCTSGKTLPA